jgi:hypothetical protein
LEVKEGKGTSHSLILKLLSWFIALLTVLVAGIGLIFLGFAVKRSTLPFNSESNYFDGAVNYHESSVFAYDFLAVVSFFAVVLFVARASRQTKHLSRSLCFR